MTNNYDHGSPPIAPPEQTTELLQAAGGTPDPETILKLKGLGESWSAGEFITEDGQIAEPPPMQFLVTAKNGDGHMPLAEPIVLSGEGGAGKSTLELELAVAAALKSEYLGMPVREMPVIFFTGEDVRAVIHKRFKTIAGRLGIDHDTLLRLKNDRLRFVDCQPEHAKLTIPVSSGAGGLYHLEASPTFKVLEEAARFYKTIIIDPFAYHFEGNDFSQKDAYAFLGLLRNRLCKAHGATVIVSCHHRKDGLGADDTSTAHVMGSVGFINAARCHFELLTVQKTMAKNMGLDLDLEGSPNPADRGRWLLYSREKCNGLPRERWFLRRDDDGILVPAQPPLKMMGGNGSGRSASADETFGGGHVQE